MSQEDSFEQDGTQGISGAVDALQELFDEQEHDDSSDDGSVADTPGPDEPAADTVETTETDESGGFAEAGETATAWTAHGGDAPTRGPSVAGDGMSESEPVSPRGQVGPDGELIDSDISDGGQSGQDSGSMS